MLYCYHKSINAIIISLCACNIYSLPLRAQRNMDQINQIIHTEIDVKKPYTSIFVYLLTLISQNENIEDDMQIMQLLESVRSTTTKNSEQLSNLLQQPHNNIHINQKKGA